MQLILAITAAIVSAQQCIDMSQTRCNMLPVNLQTSANSSIDVAAVNAQFDSLMSTANQDFGSMCQLPEFDITNGGQYKQYTELVCKDPVVNFINPDQAYPYRVQCNNAREYIMVDLCYKACSDMVTGTFPKIFKEQGCSNQTALSFVGSEEYAKQVCKGKHIVECSQFIVQDKVSDGGDAQGQTQQPYGNSNSAAIVTSSLVGSLILTFVMMK